MDRQDVEKLIAMAEDKPYAIIFNDVLIAYGNIDGSYIVKDNDFLYCVRLNKNPAPIAEFNHVSSPMEVLVIPYERVGYIRVYPSKEFLKKILTGKSDISTVNKPIVDIINDILDDSAWNTKLPTGYSKGPNAINKGPSAGPNISLKK